MKILKNIGIYVLVLLLSYFLSFVFGYIYDYLFPDSLGSGLSTDAALSIFGTPLAYIFFLLFFFSAFGDKHKYWWVGILLIPAFWFEIYFDLPHLYFPLALGLTGWLIGLGIKKLVSGSH